jgi:hypothetical protein
VEALAATATGETAVAGAATGETAEILVTATPVATAVVIANAITSLCDTAAGTIRGLTGNDREQPKKFPIFIGIFVIVEI